MIDHGLCCDPATNDPLQRSSALYSALLIDQQEQSFLFIMKQATWFSSCPSSILMDNTVKLREQSSYHASFALSWLILHNPFILLLAIKIILASPLPS